MALVKYFGHKTADFGRPLWEIVLNLKNFGAGRYVMHTGTQREFPKEPSFYKILYVRPHVIEYPETFQGNILVESVYRGVKREEPLDIGEMARFAGFRLILKEDEPELLKKYNEYLANPEPIAVIPKYANLPPVWRELIAREQGIKPSEVKPILIDHQPIIPGEGAPRRVAEEGEKPTYTIGPGGFTPLHSRLYQHVIKSREKAKEEFCSKIPDPDFIYVDRKLDKPITFPEDLKEGKHLGRFYS